MRRIILVVAGLALASATSQRRDGHGDMTEPGPATKCHKGTVIVAGGLCDKVEVTGKMCGPEEMTDFQKDGQLKALGTAAGTALTTATCNLAKGSMDTMCQLVGGTAKDLCAGDVSDYCNSQIAVAQLQSCDSDDDCKALDLATKAGSGTGGTTKKTCCSVMEKNIDTVCKDTTSVAVTQYVSINCRDVLRRGSATPFAACGLRRRQGSCHRVLSAAFLASLTPWT